MAVAFTFVVIAFSFHRKGQTLSAPAEKSQPRGTTNTPTACERKRPRPGVDFSGVPAPVRARHSERLTTRKIRGSLLRRQVHPAPWIFVGGQA
jgi:hypothetical protein